MSGAGPHQIVGGAKRQTSIEDVNAKQQAIIEITVENKQIIHRIYQVLMGQSHNVMNQTPTEKSPDPEGILPGMMTKMAKIIENAEDSNRMLHDLEQIIAGSTPEAGNKKFPCAG